MSFNSSPTFKCECGGECRFYDGALGYEAFVCKRCGEHWPDNQTHEEHEKHLKEYREGKRNGEVKL